MIYTIAVSILMFLLIGGLMVSEIRSYTNYEVVYEYGVDRNSDSYVLPLSYNL